MIHSQGEIVTRITKTENVPMITSLSPWGWPIRPGERNRTTAAIDRRTPIQKAAATVRPGELCKIQRPM
jgi:hypothetical protein